MNSKPILFSTPMVEAILEGRKSQTRRIMKTQPPEQLKPCGTGKWYWAVDPSNLRDTYYKCPYGQIGDGLWVREAWNHCIRVNSQTWEKVGAQFVYKADIKNIIPGHDKFKPSIHMPFSACRIFLEITDIRVERLQEIPLSDVAKEGCTNTFMDPNIDTFKSLWESINGPDSWQANPFVWVIEFRRIEQLTTTPNGE